MLNCVQEDKAFKNKISVAKFGGSLLDAEGKGIPKILKRIKELKAKDTVGPIVVFSAPMGCTDELIRIGESYAQGKPESLDSVFEIYERIAKLHVKGNFLKQALSEIADYKAETQETLAAVNKRFSGNVKAKTLTFGGELAMASLATRILESSGLDAYCVPVENWPIVTDDNFEDATPNYELSKKRTGTLTEPLEDGKVISLAGFLGVTADDLETVLGRGGSDLTAVFTSCLLKGRYQTDTLLFKDVPVQSADPKVVKGQKTEHVKALTYNEAHKASMMGMKIVQSPAIAMARRFMQPLRVVPIDEPEKFSVIQSETSGGEIVKCLTGKAGCAILSMSDEKSRSLEDSLRVWEKRNDFMDLGAETLETGERIRDFLFLDSDFLRKNEEKLKGFDENLKIEYGLGVVTLIGDKMKDSPGVASTAISAIPGINIKRGIFAPHTSQIIIVVEEKNVYATVAAIHLKKAEMNKSVH
ncbi:aspartate kinase [Candidatus Bathyarchaeota archaeon A05DMB-2]|nr:aspartate kinase [Candidatus Bathyarchaeota archaeon A05DMB-2]